MIIRLTDDGRLDISETELVEAFTQENVFRGVGGFALHAYPTAFEEGEFAIGFTAWRLPFEYSARQIRKLLDLKVLWRGEEFPYTFTESKHFVAPDTKSKDWAASQDFYKIRVWFSRVRDEE